MVETKLKNAIFDILKREGLAAEKIELEAPTEISHGDLTTNSALMYAKEAQMQPRELAERIVEGLRAQAIEEIERIEIAGPGFINFFLTRSFFTQELTKILTSDSAEVSEKERQEKLLIEYTDPNPFKVFHIGHLMSNTIGESLARLAEAGGADVERLCYQGDIGMHVAKAVWGMRQDTGNMPAEDDPLDAKAEFLGNAYTFGASQYEQNEETQQAIRRINKELYERTNEEILNLYTAGRRWSLEYFDTIYERLGTRFDGFFFESDMADPGRELVQTHLGNVFEKSEGAIVYPGEEKGLHTRVFLSSESMPTYEAKDLALAHAKDEVYQEDYDTSIIITAEEQRGYFKVVLSALEDILPKLAQKTVHMTHGMMKLSSGKMSSRTGDVFSAEDMIALVSQAVEEKMEDRLEAGETKRVAETVALGAIKFWVLRQAAGKDIVFDVDQAVSLEGDSGPYVQYAAVRAQSVLDRARAEGVEPDLTRTPDDIHELERSILRFDQSVAWAIDERAPHHIVHAVMQVASSFNRFYGEETIADPSDPLSSYRAALTEATRRTLEHGLSLLGIRIPEKM